MILFFLGYYLLTLSSTQGLTITKIELINGSGPYEGNLYVNGRPVCNDDWDDNDAAVVCRMLGYSSGVATFAFPSGSFFEDHIFDLVDCNGTEQSLLECPGVCTDPGYNICHASESAAGVICQDDTAITTTTTPDNARWKNTFELKGTTTMFTTSTSGPFQRKERQNTENVQFLSMLSECNITSTTTTTGGCKCGVKNSRACRRRHHKQRGGRILGGECVDNISWMVLLFFQESSPQYNCGGTIINSKYVLTALHCVVKDYRTEIENLETFSKDTAQVLVNVKSFKRRKSRIQRRQTLQLGVEEIIINTEGADLALVKVVGKIDIDKFPPICLPQKGQEYFVQKMEGVVAGWGRNGDGPGQKLRELSVPITNTTPCAAIENQTNKNNWFCFGGLKNEGACYGDSGGPVMVNEPEERWTIAGVVSGGTVDDCTSGGYGLAVDVYRWINWVTFNAADGDYCQETSESGLP